MTKITPYIKACLDKSVDTLRERFDSLSVSPVHADQLVLLGTTEQERSLMHRAGVLHVGRPVKYTTLQMRLDLKLPTPSNPARRATVTLGMGFVKPIDWIPILNLDLPADNPVAQEFVQWVKDKLDGATLFDAIKPVIQHFRDHALSLEQLRYYIPGTLLLCKVNPELERYVERLEQFRAPSHIPALPAHIHTHLTAAKEALAIAGILPPAGEAKSSSVTIQNVEWGA